MLNKSANNLLLFLFFLFAISCNTSPEYSSQGAIVAGRIDPSLCKNKMIYFYQYTDSISLFFCEKKSTDSCVIDAEGRFRIEVENGLKSGFFDLGTKDFIFAKNFFLEPGDQIKLIFDGKEMPVRLHTYKDIGKYNKFLQIFYDTFYREPKTKRNYFVISNYMLAPDYSVYINKRRNEQIAFYKKYFKGANPDTSFKYYFENETDYNWANDKVYFLWKKRTRNEFVPLDTSYFDFLKVINNDNPKALICPGYTRFINLFLTELYQEEIFNLPPGYPQSLEKCLMAKKYYIGTGRKIAYYSILNDELSGINASSAKVNREHDLFVDSLTRIAFEATADSNFFKFVNLKRK